jgi:hypothetical protein
MRVRAITIVLLLHMILLGFAACRNMGDLNPIPYNEQESMLIRKCLAGGGRPFRTEILTAQPEAVDILVVVDNSGSMAAEQAMLRDAFPTLITSLLTGDEPVRDLHVGVVSTDMGVAGYSVQTCETDPMIGDDGVLQHEPHGTGCAAEYPAYLDYSADPDSEPDLTKIEALAADFGCLAVLGTSGCGFEQQLEAAKKALVDHAGPGGANEGFLREASILLVLFVTDEEDCSAADPGIFDVSALPYSINLQCYYQSTKLKPVKDFADAFMELRPESSRVLFGFIVGVPPGEPACNGRGSELGGCLDLPAMREVVRPDGELLEYVCRYPAGCTPPDPPYPGDCVSEAFPARRFVSLAQAFGDSAVVQSICQESFLPVMAALAERFEAPAAGYYKPSDEPAVSRDPDAACRCLAECEVIEELGDDRICPEGKATYDADGDTQADFVYVRNPETDAFEAHSLCLIPQAGADCTGADSCSDPDGVFVKAADADGWWYDPGRGVLDFGGVEPEPGSPRLLLECCR